MLDGKIDTEEFKLDRFIRITMPSASNLAAFNKMLFFLDLEREYYVTKTLIVQKASSYP